jgi:hypothetical protein
MLPQRRPRSHLKIDWGDPLLASIRLFLPPDAAAAIMQGLHLRLRSLPCALGLR